LSYPIDTSMIHRHLRHVHGIVTKKLLLSFIIALRKTCSPSVRPPAPTRDQRRAKGGLVAWLDDHEPIALAYLRLQTQRTLINCSRRI
jgi:hypothetical protein